MLTQIVAGALSPSMSACALYSVEDAVTHERPTMAMVYLRRRTGHATPRKGLRATTRSWSDRTGGFRVEAELTEVLDSKVHLLKLNGVRVAVPLERLSKADLFYLNMVRGRALTPASLAASPLTRGAHARAHASC